jgi:dUTP pyrophosphatase
VEINTKRKNMGIEVKVKKLDTKAQLPTRGSEKSLCYDLYCIRDSDFNYDYNHDRDSIILLPGQSHIFHTGIIMEFPPNWSCLLWDRSGMGAKRNIHRLAGVIDNDYRGEVMISLINLSNELQTIYEGDKIIQAHFVENTDVDFIEVKKIDETNRGEGGFGSTGR